MQKIINNPQNVVDEMLEGFVKAMSDKIVNTNNPRVLKYKYSPVKDKVGIVTGGGSGHKPAFIGYIGRNMVDAVAVGDPSAFVFFLGLILSFRSGIFSFLCGNNNPFLRDLEGMSLGIFPIGTIIQNQVVVFVKLEILYE